MSLSGLIVIADHTAEAKEQMHEASVKALKNAADELLRVANETVPFEEGILAGSGEVSMDAAALVAQVGYGGEAKAYAARQHEDVTLHHDAGRRAKWLEMAAKENAKRLGIEIAMDIKSEVG